MDAWGHWQEGNKTAPRAAGLQTYFCFAFKYKLPTPPKPTDAGPWGLRKHSMLRSPVSAGQAAQPQALACLRPLPPLFF